MSPTCSKAALRVLVSILLASSVANAAALPHQVLDPRTPLAQDEFNPEQALQAVASAVSEDPGNFFDKISDDLNSRSAWQVFLDFVTRLFGPREDADDDEDDTTTTTTVFVTPTPAEVTSASAEATPTSDIVIPPGPPSTSTDVPTSTSPSEESSTTEEAMFSILPIGPMSEFINATFLTPEFSTAAETDLPLLTPSAGIPPFPANSTSEYLLPTAVPITDEFSVTIPVELLSTGVPSVGIPPYPANSTFEYVLPTAVPITDEFSVTIPVELLSTGVPSAVNSSAPAGTGLPLPWAGNTTVSAINPTLILTNPIAPTPVVNDTVALNTTISLTSFVVVTETIVPLPFPGTGTGAAASAGTGFPISDVASPLWPNSTYVAPTILPGTGLPVSAGTGTGVPVSAGTGFPISMVASPLWPNSTYVAPTILPGTGTGSPPIATALPLSDLPISSNVTNATISASAIPIANATSVVQLPITVTGLPGGVINITVTIPVAPFLNTTFTAPSFPQGTGALQPSFATAIPPPPSDFPDFPNTTYTLIEPTTIPFPSGTAASVGTILPIASLVESVLFPNTTIATIIDIATETATATLILPSLPAETDTTVEFPGLSSLRTICRDPQIRVITLPLIDRFYGPAGYPSLYPFPGCTAPNARQAIQAPGLLDCSALGVEVQRCQARGKRVLLSVHGDGLDAVSGNAGFGTPGAPAQPFGAYFGENGLDKRQKGIDKPVGNGKPSGVASKAASPSPKPGRPKPLIGVPEDFPGSAPVASLVSKLADTASKLPLPSAVRDFILEPLLGKPVEVPGAKPAESALSAVIGLPAVQPTESARPEIFVDPIIDPATGQPLIIGAPVPIDTSIPEPTIAEPIFGPLLGEPVDTATPEPFFPLESPPIAILLPAPSAPKLELPTPFLFEPLETPSPELIDVLAPAPVETPIAEPSDALVGAPVETATPPFEVLDESLWPIQLPAFSAPTLELPTDLIFTLPTEAPTPDGIILDNPPLDFSFPAPSAPDLPLPSDLLEPPVFTPLETPNSEPIIAIDPPIGTGIPAAAPIEDVSFPPFPIFNISIPLGHGPVILNGSIPAPPLSTAEPVIDEPSPQETTSSSFPTAEPDVVDPTPAETTSPSAPPNLPDSNPNEQNPPFPNLFSSSHPPSAFALTLSSLFGETHTERADLRPLGPDAPLPGSTWLNRVSQLARPLGEEVVVDGFDVQVPAEWRGSYQDTAFHALTRELRRLSREAWIQSGEDDGGPADLGADGEGVVFFGWVGGAVKRNEGLREGWKVWDGGI